MSGVGFRGGGGGPRKSGGEEVFLFEVQEGMPIIVSFLKCTSKYNEMDIHRYKYVCTCMYMCIFLHF